MLAASAHAKCSVKCYCNYKQQRPWLTEFLPQYKPKDPSARENMGRTKTEILRGQRATKGSHNSYCTVTSLLKALQWSLSIKMLCLLTDLLPQVEWSGNALGCCYFKVGGWQASSSGASLSAMHREPPCKECSPAFPDTHLPTTLKHSAPRCCSTPGSCSVLIMLFDATVNAISLSR